jgi:hypothetical protein
MIKVPLFDLKFLIECAAAGVGTSNRRHFVRQPTTCGKLRSVAPGNASKAFSTLALSSAVVKEAPMKLGEARKRLTRSVGARLRTAASHPSIAPPGWPRSTAAAGLSCRTAMREFQRGGAGRRSWTCCGGVRRCHCRKALNSASSVCSAADLTGPGGCCRRNSWNSRKSGIVASRIASASFVPKPLPLL